LRVVINYGGIKAPDETKACLQRLISLKTHQLAIDPLPQTPDLNKKQQHINSLNKKSIRNKQKHEQLTVFSVISM